MNRGRVDRKLLDSYNEERLENAKRLLKTTDRFFGFAAGTDWLMNFLRLHVLPPIAEHIFSLDAVRRYAFPAISQIGITYRHSSLSDHARDEDFEIRAGDRMPYFLIDGQNVFDRLKEPKFHFLVFSARPANLNPFKEMQEQYAMLLDFNAIPMAPEVTKIFGTEKAFSILLRPDNHVGAIWSGVSVNRVQDYLTKFIQHGDAANG